jgi:hypothetical protein
VKIGGPDSIISYDVPMYGAFTDFENDRLVTKLKRGKSIKSIKSIGVTVLTLSSSVVIMFENR